MGDEASIHTEMILASVEGLRKDFKPVSDLVMRHDERIRVLDDGYDDIKRILQGNGREGLIAEVRALRNSLDMHLTTAVVPTRTVDWDKVAKAVIAAMAIIAYLLGVN